MEEAISRVECGDTNCDFATQSPDEQEVVHAFMEHEKSAHNKDISESEVRAKMKTVQPEQNQQSNKQQPERDGHQDLRQTRNPNQKQDSKNEQSNKQGQQQTNQQR